MSSRSSISIHDGQTAVENSSMIFSVDFEERDGIGFAVSSATVTVLDASTKDPISGLEDISCSIGPGETGGEIRVQTSLIPDISLAAGFYLLLWSITLDDGQTRFGTQGLRIDAI